MEQYFVYSTNSVYHIAKGYNGHIFLYHIQISYNLSGLKFLHAVRYTGTGNTVFQDTAVEDRLPVNFYQHFFF